MKISDEIANKTPNILSKTTTQITDDHRSQNIVYPKLIKFLNILRNKFRNFAEEKEFRSEIIRYAGKENKKNREYIITSGKEAPNYKILRFIRKKLNPYFEEVSYTVHFPFCIVNGIILPPIFMRKESKLKVFLTIIGMFIYWLIFLGISSFIILWFIYPQEYLAFHRAASRIENPYSQYFRDEYYFLN